jgi:hypothetical protein
MYTDPTAKCKGNLANLAVHELFKIASYTASKNRASLA